MIYSINSLTQVADCNVLLAWAQKERAALSYKQLSEERITTKYAETSTEVDAVLQGVITEIAAQDTIIGALPDGRAKEDAIDKKTRLEYKKFVLENRKENYGVVALLEKEMDLARVQQELAEVDAFISLVETKKTALSA